MAGLLTCTLTVMRPESCQATEGAKGMGRAEDPF